MALAIKGVQTRYIEIKKKLSVQSHSTIEQRMQIGKENMSYKAKKNISVYRVDINTKVTINMMIENKKT